MVPARRAVDGGSSTWDYGPCSTQYGAVGDVAHVGWECYVRHTPRTSGHVHGRRLRDLWPVNGNVVEYVCTHDRRATRHVAIHSYPSPMPSIVAVIHRGCHRHYGRREDRADPLLHIHTRQCTCWVGPYLYMYGTRTSHTRTCMYVIAATSDTIPYGPRLLHAIAMSYNARVSSVVRNRLTVLFVTVPVSHVHRQLSPHAAMMSKYQAFPDNIGGGTTCRCTGPLLF